MEFFGKKWGTVEPWWVTHKYVAMVSEIYLTMDSKRRISIPKKSRKDIGSSVVITRHLDGCLSVYAAKLWESGKTKVQQLNKRLSINDKHRKISRFLTVGDQIDVDASGRIVIPDHLASFAEFNETVVLIGTEEGFQLWSEQRWESYGMPSMDEVQKLAESKEFQQLTDEPVI